MFALSRLTQVLALLPIALILSACGGGSSSGGSPDAPETFTVEGKVSNGPLAGSTVQVFDANGGGLLESTTTDGDGRYSAGVSIGGPYRVRTSGGTLRGVNYTGVLEASCDAGSGCNVTPYTTVLIRMGDEHGFNTGDAASQIAAISGLDVDPFIVGVSAQAFDLDAARQAISLGEGLSTWVDGAVKWVTGESSEAPPGLSKSDPTPAPDPDPVPDPDPETYAVTTTAGAGGDISPANQTVAHGATTTFTVSPDAGYSIDTVVGCGGSLDGNTYTTGAITAACTVEATFSTVPEPTVAELLTGEYQGRMRSPKNVFFTDSTSITFEIEGSASNITKDAFFGRTCRLEGSLSGEAFPLSGSGTFDCSDFTTGTWTSSKIAKTNAHSSLSEVEMVSGGDIYTIKVAGFRETPPPHYDPDLDFWLPNVSLDQFPGRYDGELQTLDECAASTFTNSSTDLTITIDNDDIFLEQDAFFEGICEFEGEIASFDDGVIAASGNYRCDNFDQGTWSTDHLVMTGDDSMFAELIVDVPARGCSYTVRYTGFKGAVPDPEEPPVTPVVSLLLYGGANNDVYLGCLTCDAFHPESVCNSTGTYGNRFSMTSIWNQFGEYGSPFQQYSPWNRFSSSGPAITGTDGLFYGYFTVNPFRSGRTTIQPLVDILDFYTNSQDLLATRSYACEN